ncbi:hypothetical protein PoB_002068000 [Plakobranchus ocellatus]|uniref:Uncharacterized protein n=1 Tax=Plakobranchus ocellatus TaxID=259542 RepID=A0AAV3ZEZ5_9GAST|nr:hypothetical protein PoB_002068000 [Plakobranchus ocellatus]
MLKADDRDNTVLSDSVPGPSREYMTESGRSGDDRLFARISTGTYQQENNEKDSIFISVVASKHFALLQIPWKVEKKANTTRELGKK